MRKSKAAVFAVHKDETADGRFHEVMWARDGNLNAAFRRGHFRRFRMWANARRFAKQKAKQMNAEAIFS